MSDTVITAPTAASERLSERELSKLHWRCRRGLLENDLFIQQFFKRFEPEEQVQDGENLAPLSFIVEEEQAKQAALEAEASAKTAESAENKTETEAAKTENQI